MSAVWPGSMCCAVVATRCKRSCWPSTCWCSTYPSAPRVGEVRKATLASILRNSCHGVRPNEHLAYDCGLTVFQHACALGCEGIFVLAHERLKWTTPSARTELLQLEFNASLRMVEKRWVRKPDEGVQIEDMRLLPAAILLIAVTVPAKAE